MEKLGLRCWGPSGSGQGTTLLADYRRAGENSRTFRGVFAFMLWEDQTPAEPFM